MLRASPPPTPSPRWARGGGSSSCTLILAWSSSADHERASAQIAAAILPNYGYTPAHIQAICGMIMATKLPQAPHTLLEQIVADADLDVLGRPDFVTRNQDLHTELAA